MDEEELLVDLLAYANKFINSQYDCNIAVGDASYNNIDLLTVYRIDQLYKSNKISEDERNSFIMSALWLLDLLLMILVIHNTYINYILVLLFLMILFFGVGIALWTLSLLLHQATEYKEENDLTI